MPSLPLKNSKERNNNIKKPFKSFTTKRMKTSKRKKKKKG
ncbi:hypothetical protein AWRI1631_72390 [Saccharomyces cerevisiae AWRI1631]|uniref:Uncharacterized protein n=1 Tax=Saccharomyces cerevisiae (strain AWRI1631) TaxID=545124 RepID=B5VIW2_YEAS6|nr:hypothetical protein AWRI1631_72390 [Saccharomyces cerevisiae AWRI1631]